MYGTVLINGYPVVGIPDQDPYLKLFEHVPQALPTNASSWPQYSPPDMEKYNLEGRLPVVPPRDGYYLAVFNDPDYGPTTAAFDIEAGLNNAIFPFRDDTSNTYTATEISPFALGSKALQGNSAHCPLDLSYEIQPVVDLVVDVP